MLERNDNLDILYRDIILDHFRSPRGKKKIETPSLHAEGMNPSCGDELQLDLTVEDGRISAVHVNCRGCAISVASASMLAETIKGKTIDEVSELRQAVAAMLKGEGTALPDEHGDLDALAGVRQFPVRIKCALLAWMTLAEGLKNFSSGAASSSTISTEDDGAAAQS